MASIERTAYPRFKPSLTANELQTLYEPTEEERDFVSTHARGEAQQLTLLTLLKCQQHLGYLPALADVPDANSHVSLPAAPPLTADVRCTSKRKRRSTAIANSSAPTWTSSPMAKAVKTWSKQRSSMPPTTMSDPADLINLAVEHLIQQRFELPAFSTLDRLVTHVRHGVHQDLYARITASLERC